MTNNGLQNTTQKTIKLSNTNPMERVTFMQGFFPFDQVVITLYLMEFTYANYGQQKHTQLYTMQLQYYQLSITFLKQEHSSQ
jgi:hypothetical protein